LRSEAASLTDQGATILGIVGQDRADLAQFVARTPLPFPLLSDESRAVIQAYAVFNPLNFDAFRIAHPSAFLIDPQGLVRWTYVAASQTDWPQTSLVAAELARLRVAAAETDETSG
jgi:peroxiredoxin